MLNLVVVPEGVCPPDLPEAASPGVTVWRDQAGAPVAYGERIEDRRVIHVPGVGAFRFTEGRADVEGVPLPGADPDLVLDAFRRMVAPLALQAMGREVLHSSAVVADGGVIALCAVSGVGKTTIAWALHGRGHPMWADDAVCFQAGPEAVRALPLPFAPRLRPESVAHFGSAGNGDVTTPASADLGAVLVLRRSQRGGPRMRHLPAAEAFPAVLTHAYCFDAEDTERTRRMVAAYLDLVERVPVFELTFPHGLEQLGEIVHLIESELRQRRVGAS
jgi:hypothetical protein